MQINEKAPSARRIDLSNCKLLSTYGRNPADSTKDTRVKAGLVKPLFTKVGELGKPGLSEPR
jgi:hypothetical protein